MVWFPLASRHGFCPNLIPNLLPVIHGEPLLASVMIYGAGDPRPQWVGNRQKAMQRELGDRVSLVGIGKGIKYKDKGIMEGKEKEKKRERGTEKERKEEKGEGRG